VKGKEEEDTFLIVPNRIIAVTKLTTYFIIITDANY